MAPGAPPNNAPRPIDTFHRVTDLIGLVQTVSRLPWGNTEREGQRRERRRLSRVARCSGRRFEASHLTQVQKCSQLLPTTSYLPNLSSYSCVRGRTGRGGGSAPVVSVCAACRSRGFRRRGAANLVEAVVHHHRGGAHIAVGGVGGAPEVDDRLGEGLTSHLARVDHPSGAAGESLRRPTYTAQW